MCFGVIVAYNTSQRAQELTMSRKLIHSVRALVVSLGLLSAGLFVATLPAAPASLSTATATEDAIESRTESGERERTAKPHSRQRRAMARESMALPFFSFAQGLRSGNGS
jgi:hypothetical protein